MALQPPPKAFNLNAGLQKKQKIQELVKILHTDKILQQLYTNTGQQLIQMMKYQYPSLPEAALNVTIEEIKKWMQQVITATEITRLSANVYDKYFTDYEIIELVKFYTSPAGGKFLELSPTIIHEVAQSVQNKIIEAAPGLQAHITKVLTDAGFAVTSDDDSRNQ